VFVLVQAVIDYYDNLRGDVLLWSDVMGKLEYHAIWSVSKHTATNSMNRIWEAIVGREVCKQCFLFFCVCVLYYVVLCPHDLIRVP
jgi:hypothetical protein